MRLAAINPASIIVKDRFRRDFGNFEELKLSIKTKGLITPIAVQDLENGSFLLLAGERRLKACIELEHHFIEAKIFTGEMSEYDIRCIELAENLDRKDFTWQEKTFLEAEIHRIQVSQHGEKHAPGGPGWSQADTAKFLGSSTGAVSQNLKLAAAMEAIPQLKDCATKDEAMKTLRLLQEKMIHEELMERVKAASEEAATATSADEQRMAMLDSYIVSDALEGLLSLKAETMDFIEIDPPYSIGLDKVKRGGDIEEYTEIDDISYYSFMGKVIDECTRVLKSSRWLVLWHAYSHSLILKGMLEARGYKVSSSPAIWAKPAGQTNHPESSMANCYELFHYASKGNSILFKQGRSNIFHVSPVPPNKKIHPTEKPIELLEAILQAFTIPGYKILVPFLGSGVTLMAAANLRCEAFGFDLSPLFKRSYEVRILSQTHGKYFNSTEEGRK